MTSRKDMKTKIYLLSGTQKSRQEQCQFASHPIT